MFEKEAEEYSVGKAHEHYNYLFEQHAGSPVDFARWCFQDGAEFGYNKAKEELTERLDNATEIIELMKDLFFDCWQEKGLKAIKFEQRVNDFLKGE